MPLSSPMPRPRLVHATAAATPLAAPATLSAGHTPTWPTLAEMVGARGPGRAGAAVWLKTAWRQWCSRRHQATLLQVLARQPAWAQCFARQPNYFRCAISHFIDRRHGTAQRIATMAADLSTAGDLLGPALADRLARGDWLPLWSLHDGVQLCLGLNDVSLHEGLWALALRDGQGRRLYYLSFCFRSPQALLVSTVQGPAGGEQDDARALIRQLTKQAEGLRPQALLMAGLRAACQAWGIDQLAGIAPEHHIKGRWNLRSSRLRFDYAGFWQEQGGQRADDGHWQLPPTLPCRAAQDAPPNKRAMYRRRQAMLDDLAHSLAQALGPLQPAARLAA